MKYLFIIILTFFLISCSIFKKKNYEPRDLKIPTKEDYTSVNIEVFQLKRIDTTIYRYNNVFYMEKGDSIYKVVSKKELIEPCERMVIDNFYSLKLKGTYPKMLAQSYLIGGAALYGGEGITIERNVYKMKWDVYLTPYIRGVCYIRD